VNRQRHLKSAKKEKPSRRVKLKREGGFLVAVHGKRITMKQTRALMDKFP
jgi:hypothetical protein